MELNRTGWVYMKSDEARNMHFQHQNSNSFRFAIRGQFHKAKTFVITKVIFVITNVCEFYSLNLRFVLPNAIYKFKIFLQICI